MAKEVGRPVAAVFIGDADRFLQAVDRHRLAVCLGPHCQSLGLPPVLAAELQQRRRREHLTALPLVATALEVLQALEQAGLRVLLFKGLALALQTTGQATGRGLGDIDLLVAPRDLVPAVAALERIGFVRPAGSFIRGLESGWGHYSRWAGYELSLVRQGHWLDLHWALSHVRAPLPSFESAWSERQIFGLNGRDIATLGPQHALLHACVHAAKDQWMCLRSLVDIDRLARSLPQADLQNLSRHTCVRLSGAVAHATVAGPHLMDLMGPVHHDLQWAIRRANWAQQRPRRAEADGPWSPWQWWLTVWRLARLSHSPVDWLRIFAYQFLRPVVFNDPQTGLDRGLVGAVLARWRQLQGRLQRP